MVHELKDFVKDKRLASFRVAYWIGTYSKQEICNFIGISRPTLNRRLKNHAWKMNELKLINQKLPF